MTTKAKPRGDNDLVHPVAEFRHHLVDDFVDLFPGYFEVNLENYDVIHRP